MVKSKLESYVKKTIPNQDYIEITEMAKKDIYANKILFDNKTTLPEVIKIMAMCLHLLERCRA